MTSAQMIINSTQEIFATMLMMEVTPEAPLAERISKYRFSTSGIIGMAGTVKGLLAIHAPNAVAMAITSNFLGMDVEEINEDVQDALGELANMLAGSVKTHLTETGKDIQLSIPSAICGEEYVLDYHARNDGAMVPFATAAGNFLVELQVEYQE